MRYTYDIRTGLKRIKTKTAAAFVSAATVVASAVVLGAVVVPASAEGNHQTPIKVGPIAVVAQADIGTCNNVWALDSFNKFYTITDNKNGTFNVKVVYKDGTFVTLTGPSPGACESGADNGNTVVAGVNGTTDQEYNGTVTGTLSGNKCTLATCVDTTTILNKVLSSGWAWTVLSDGGHWTWTGHYEAGCNGTWFDTSVNWPLNDRGDITGTASQGKNKCHEDKDHHGNDGDHGHQGDDGHHGDQNRHRQDP